MSYTLKPEGNDHYTLECGDTLAEGVETSPENQRVDLRWKPSAGAYGTISGTTDAQPTVDVRFHTAADDKAEFAADVTGGIYRASMSSALDSGDYVGTVATRDMDTIYAAGYVDGTTQAQAAGKTPTVALKKGEAVRQDVKVVVGGTATGKVIDAQGKPGKGWIVRAEPVKEGLAVRYTPTKSDGTFTLPGLDSTDYRFSAGEQADNPADVEWTYLGNVKDKNASTPIAGMIGKDVAVGDIDLRPKADPEAPEEQDPKGDDGKQEQPPAQPEAPKPDAPKPPAKPDAPKPQAPAAPAKKGWAWTGSAWNYIQPSGAKATGWLKDGAAWYYMDATGTMRTGWIHDGVAWYCLKANGAMATGWVATGGHWYYLKANGAMATGWVADGGRWYFMDGSGAMRTGWVATGGHWYYMLSNGSMSTGWVLDGGKWYFMNASGAWVR